MVGHRLRFGLLLMCSFAAFFLSVGSQVTAREPTTTEELDLRVVPSGGTVLASNPGGSKAAQERKRTKVHEGKRVRRKKLPFTAQPIPIWAFPLVLTGGLSLMSMGIALVAKANQAEDERRLTEVAPLSREVPVDDASRPDVTPRAPPGPDGSRARAAPARDWEKGHGLDVASAWRALGRGSEDRLSVVTHTRHQRRR